MSYVYFFCFFQAEDGIRDKLVTGVQTCALPISSVELRGIPVGRVSALRLEYDPASDEIRVPATLEIAPHRIASPETAALPRDDKKGVTEATNKLFEHLIAKGLRARLAPDNLLIGSRLVALEFVENAEPAELVQKEPYPELPAVAGSGLDEIARSATA